MKNLFQFCLVATLFLVCLNARAQEASPIDFMRMSPNQMKANPAADLPYESVMSLVVGNLGMDAQNTTLRYDNLFDFNAQNQPTTLNLRKLANSLKESNFLGLDAQVDLFTLYRRLNQGMLTINYGVKTQANAQYNDGLIQLLGYGNSAFVGENNPAKVDVDVNAQVYQEFAVGYQRNITEKLSVGGRVKLLFGFANVNTQSFDAKLFTDADSYTLRLEENIAMRMAVPKVLYVSEEGKLMTDGPFKAGQLFRNPGFGIDLAAEYRFDARFSAVAAVQDLGFIHWGLNGMGLQGRVHDAGRFYDDGNFLFEGLDIDQLQRIFSDEWYREQFLDTLQKYFQLEFTPMEAYNTALNTQLLLRGNYDLDAHNRFSAQVQGRFLGSAFRPALTLAYDGNFYDKLDVCVTYTMMPHSFDNIGLGISGRVFRTCQIYLTTGNVVALFNPLNTSWMNLKMGVVFVLTPEGKVRVYE
ncbi:MAG: hypothetical protein IJ057_01085 [Bacteroidales bacterium]|nr:hypothetical protein [Bacteroidales bacterium]